MSIEYLITCPAQHQVPVRDVLSHLCSHWDNIAGRGYFCAVPVLADNAMPDASVAVESGGVYFCDHGGKGRDYLGRVVAALISYCDQVTVQEYES